MFKKTSVQSKRLPLYAAILPLTAFAAGFSATLYAEESSYEPTQSSTLEKMMADSTTKINLRYRFEGVDQNGFDKDAKANTVRTRINWTSGTIGHLNATLEFDDLHAIGSEHYNSTNNGNSSYPVVADPEGTEVNQAYLRYKKDHLVATGGRQRINLGDQRFVGGVGWRQNEQTFDAARLEYKSGIFSVDYSYANNVNRIFGPEGDKADLKGDVHLLNGSLYISPEHTFTAFGYGLNFDNNASLSSNTYGLRYSGNFKTVKLLASYAQQSETGHNSVGYDADYSLLQVSGKAGSFGLKAGVEVMGSDKGVKAFTTPLATLHKFQGFADKFLNTPANGVQDTYLGASTKAGPVVLKLAYHDFQSDEGGDKLGSEWDAAAIYPINKNVKALIKYANYSADTHASDTQKLWFQLQLSL